MRANELSNDQNRDCLRSSVSFEILVVLDSYLVFFFFGTEREGKRELGKEKKMIIMIRKRAKKKVMSFKFSVVPSLGLSAKFFWATEKMLLITWVCAMFYHDWCVEIGYKTEW